MAKKILVVDDESDIAELFCFRLRTEGFEAVAAHDGTDGLAKAKSEKPDLILLDIMMPGLDGWEVEKRLRAEAATASTPLIFFTAARNPDLEEKIKKSTAVDCITKPYEPELALQKINKALGLGRKAA